MAEQNRIEYNVTHAEVDPNPKNDGAPGTVAFTIRTAGGTITANGKVRETPRLVLTNAMLARPGFARSVDKKARVITISLPVERTGRKARTGTDLSVFEA